MVKRACDYSWLKHTKLARRLLYTKGITRYTEKA